MTIAKNHGGINSLKEAIVTGSGSGSGAVEQQQQQQLIPPLNDVYILMRDGIVATTFFLILLLVSHLILRKFLKAKDQYKQLYIPRILCTFCFSVSLASMLLIPITIFTNEILTTYPESYYTQWLNRDLVFSFWNKIFWGANLSLFIILPYTYFYYEAEGIKGKTILNRMYDAFLVLLLVAVVFVGFIFIIYKLFFEIKDNNDKSIVGTDYLPFSFSLISTSGTLLVLFCIPRGFNILISRGVSFRVVKPVDDEIKAALFEIEVIKDKIQRLKKLMNSASCKDHTAVQDKIQRLKMTKEQLRAFILSIQKPKYFSSTLSRGILSLFFTMVNLSITGWIVFKVFIHFSKRLLELLQSTFSMTLSASAKVDNVYDFLAYTRQMGYIESLLETTIIIYLMVSAFVGFFSISFFDNIRPRRYSTSLRKVIINTGIILLMSSSFPVVVRILEISRFDLMGYYLHTDYLRNYLFKLFYRLTFIGLVIRSYIQLFHTQHKHFSNVPWIDYFVKFNSIFKSKKQNNTNDDDENSRLSNDSHEESPNVDDDDSSTSNPISAIEQLKHKNETMNLNNNNLNNNNNSSNSSHTGSNLNSVPGRLLSIIFSNNNSTGSLSNSANSSPTIPNLSPSLLSPNLSPISLNPSSNHRQIYPMSPISSSSSSSSSTGTYDNNNIIPFTLNTTTNHFKYLKKFITIPSIFNTKQKKQ